MEGKGAWLGVPSSIFSPTGPQDDAYEHFLKQGKFPAPGQPFPPTYHQKLVRLRIMMLCWTVVLVAPWIWYILHLTSLVMMVEFVLAGCE